MSRLRALRHLLSTGGGGGGSPLAITHDTRWGTSTDANGWITFGLSGGCKRTYWDSVNGNDANNGLTPATAVLTFSRMWTVFQSGWIAGDQIMLAGGSAGGNYNDPDDTSSLTVHCGTGPSVMTVIQSYDRADPTGATTKFGELVGLAMPVFNLLSVNSTFLNVVNISGAGYVAVKGVEIKATVNLAGSSLGISWQTNKHPGQVYQNVRFNGVGIANSSGLGTVTAATNTVNGGLISKFSMWNSNGIFIEETDGWRCEEFFTANCGWNIGSVRDDPVTYGGPLVFTHAFYLHASNTNMVIQRSICVDATDGFGSRCGSIAFTQNISIDNPVGFTASGKSTDVVAERPDGAPWYQDDGVIMGSDKEICTGSPGGWALEFINNFNGSYSRNVALLDFDSYGYDAGFNRYLAGTRVSASQVPTYMLIDKWSGFNYAITGESDSGTDLANYHVTVTNSITDVAIPGLNGTGNSGDSTRSTAPAGYKTRAQVYLALGYVSKAAWVNAMLYRPDLVGPTAQAICGIALPAMGLTPLYATVSPPAAVAGAPTIYPTAAVDLTPSTLNFTRGVPSAMLLTGTTVAARLACADLPAGFSMAPFRLTTTGTATVGTNTITGVGSITGITKGMYVEMRSSALAATSLFPAGTVVTAVSGTTITCSANATASSSGESVFVSAGGRTIYYDGSGTGAATPTIHVVETPKDTGMVSHTTALTLSIS